MSLLWFVGPAAAGVGIVLAAVWHRRTVAATQELLGSLHRFGEVGRSVDDLRRAGDEVVASAARVRRR